MVVGPVGEAIGITMSFFPMAVDRPSEIQSEHVHLFSARGAIIPEKTLRPAFQVCAMVAAREHGACCSLRCGVVFMNSEEAKVHMRQPKRSDTFRFNLC